MADPVLGPVAVSNIFRVSFLQRLFGQRIMNSLYYRVTDVPGVDPPDRWNYMVSLADYQTGAGLIQEKMLACQSSSLAHEFIRVTHVKLPDMATDPYAEIATAEIGDMVDSPGTANTAVSIEKRSTFGIGKPQQGIGRMQLGGIPQGGYDAGIITNAYAALVQPLADELLDSIITAGVTAIPVNYGLDDPLTGHSYPLFGTSVKRTIRIMRRRTVGVGE